MNIFKRISEIEDPRERNLEMARFVERSAPDENGEMRITSEDVGMPLAELDFDEGDSAHTKILKIYRALTTDKDFSVLNDELVQGGLPPVKL